MMLKWLVEHFIIPERARWVWVRPGRVKSVLLNGIRLMTKLSSYILSLGLDMYTPNVLNGEDNDHASLVFLVGLLALQSFGLILMPVDQVETYARIGKIPSRKEHEIGDAVTPRNTFLRGTRRAKLTVSQRTLEIR